MVILASIGISQFPILAYLASLEFGLKNRLSSLHIREF